MAGWGGYMGPPPAPKEPEETDCDTQPLVYGQENFHDHEEGIRAELLVGQMPRKLRGNLMLLRYIYREHPERVR